MLNRLQESDIKLLRVFYAVASCNGFTAAEPVLRMQRPNISAAIKKLEERLDLVLCHRGRGGFQMTKEGEVVFQETKRIFNSFDNFVFNLKTLHDDFSGHITLMLMSGLPKPLMNAVSLAVDSTMAKFDDIHINIQTRLYNEIEHVAVSGECHLVVSSFEMVKPESLVFHPLEVSTRGRLYAHQRHPLARQKDKPVEELKLEDYAAVGINGLSTANYVAEKQKQRLAIHTFSDSYESCLAAVMSGHYIGLLPDYIGQDPANQLVPVGGELFSFEHQLFVINGKNTILNPVLKYFIRELAHFAGQEMGTA
ncbi:HTH-type transcriptional activator BauR [Saliniradius amylolyticus]|uniref:HTH-type transcriptional activator BauR n=1 Tax=Saliniradius amylolyticus TaxID=2183582 RepID=A0A2S2E1B8_9ALTE|nr:LysR family transcriptional regulator [Saliniradius amylolyticus]AWL11441.1 HTH-type transcriptional activator BauR [Saliniradius amylolyticus]